MAPTLTLTSLHESNERESLPLNVALPDTPEVEAQGMAWRTGAAPVLQSTDDEMAQVKEGPLEMYISVLFRNESRCRRLYHRFLRFHPNASSANNAALLRVSGHSNWCVVGGRVVGRHERLFVFTGKPIRLISDRGGPPQSYLISNRRLHQKLAHPHGLITRRRGQRVPFPVPLSISRGGNWAHREVYRGEKEGFPRE